MQDPNEDTEWNDILRAKGIIPEKPKEAEVTEDDIVNVRAAKFFYKSAIEKMRKRFDESDCRCWRRQ